MKTVKVLGLLSVVALMSAGSAWADQTGANQNIARKAVMTQSADKADQPWAGASLHADLQKQQVRKQLNLQYISKRSML